MPLYRWTRVVVVTFVSAAVLLLATSQSLALQVDDKAPDFALPATTADKVSLADYLGKKHVVVFFELFAFGSV
jgi:peroxiredoxin